MVDFTKMLDPVFQAEMKAKREAEEAVHEKKESDIKAALSKFSGGEAFSRLTKIEQDFIDSCERSRRNYGRLTLKQEKWLFDLAARESRNSSNNLV